MERTPGMAWNPMEGIPKNHLLEVEIYIYRYIDHTWSLHNVLLFMQSNMTAGSWWIKRKKRSCEKVKFMPPFWNRPGICLKNFFKVLLENRPDLNVINMAGLPGLLKWSFISMWILEDAPLVGRGTDLFAYISANLHALQWRSYRYETQPLSVLRVP